MTEYIDRDRVLELAYYLDLDYFMEIPAADVAPVVHAKWVDCNWMYECDICRCQVNKGLFKANLRYCPNCGAKMKLEE